MSGCRSSHPVPPAAGESLSGDNWPRHQSVSRAENHSDAFAFCHFASNVQFYPRSLKTVLNKITIAINTCAL